MRHNFVEVTTCRVTAMLFKTPRGILSRDAFHFGIENRLAQDACCGDASKVRVTSGHSENTVGVLDVLGNFGAIDQRNRFPCAYGTKIQQFLRVFGCTVRRTGEFLTKFVDAR
mmetsp:Transcript_10367/g.32116  ORF Transcript_10367/g.32116 Transcript_10367/m.32116 type:complete len:113 (-) Transcript_10367:395-733(-)